MSLTQAAHKFKAAIRIVGVVVAIIVIFRIIVLVYGLTIKLPEGAEALPKITTKYGQIPPLVIDRVPINLPTNFSTSLDLVEPELPADPTVANVYPVLKAPYGFLSEDRAKEIAQTFNMTQQPIKTSPLESLWNAPNISLVINDQNLNFHYEYNYTADPTIFVPGTFASQTDTIRRALLVLKRHKIATDEEVDSNTGDFITEQPPVYLLKYENQRLQPTLRIVESSAARVDFKRQNAKYKLSNGKAQDIPFVSPHYVEALTYVLLAPIPAKSTIEKPDILVVNRTLWRYRSDDGSTYPLISSKDAWENIQKDPSLFTTYVGNLKLGPIDKLTETPLIQGITARNVYLAYYDTKDQQDYLQPVWVFSGKAKLAQGGELDWAGYVPAVHPKYIKSTTGQ
ncbi:hypothetical protein HGA91_06320 [candidate division WWE3 bacterium]|nr:hypothetical protein [candidate division WWE3 bacterium]